MTGEELKELRRELEALKAQKSDTNKNAGTCFYESQNTEHGSGNLFVKLFKSFFGNYFNFEGRASPGEFFALSFLLDFGIATGASSSVYSEFYSKEPSVIFCDIIDILLLVTLSIGYFSLIVRRFHDGGFSGLWAILSGLIMIIGCVAFGFMLGFVEIFDKLDECVFTDVSFHVINVLWIFILTSIPSDKGVNRFGPPSDFKI